MNVNSIIFPAPTDDKYPELLRHSDDIIFVPKKLENGDEFHIPCFLQESYKKPNTNKIFLYFHGNAEVKFIFDFFFRISLILLQI